MAGDVDEEEEEDECTSLLMGETPLELTEMAGAMSFLPKFSRLLETLLMLRGAVFVLGPELGEQKYGDVSHGKQKPLFSFIMWYTLIYKWMPYMANLFPKIILSVLK